MEGMKFVIMKKYEFQQRDLYCYVDLLGTFVPLEFLSKKSFKTFVFSFLHSPRFKWKSVDWEFHRRNKAGNVEDSRVSNTRFVENNNGFCSFKNIKILS